MSTDSLLQRHILETRLFQLKENGVLSAIKSPLSSESVLIPYENIPVEPYEFSKLSRNSLLFSFCLIGILVGLSASGKAFSNAAVGICFISVVITILMRFFLFRKSFVMYGQGQKLRVVLLKNNPNKEAFEDFVNQMQLKKNAYLRERYLVFQFNSNNPSHIQTVQWLKTMGAMKQEEIERLGKDYPPS